MTHKKIFFNAVIVSYLLCMTLAVNAQNEVIEQIKEKVMELGCQVYGILFYLAAAIAALFLLFSGVKYMTSESPDDRYGARDRAVYAIVGLIVVMLSCPLVEYFIQETPMAWDKRPDCCPVFSFGESGSGGGTEDTAEEETTNFCSDYLACEECQAQNCKWCSGMSGVGCLSDCGSSAAEVVDCPSGDGTSGGNTGGNTGGDTGGLTSSTDCSDKDGYCEDTCDTTAGEQCVSGTQECSSQCCCVLDTGSGSGSTDCDDLGGACLTQNECTQEGASYDIDVECKTSQQCSPDCCCTEKSTVSIRNVQVV